MMTTMVIIIHVIKLMMNITLSAMHDQMGLYLSYKTDTGYFICVLGCVIKYLANLIVIGTETVLVF